jgi:signal peptidase II
VATRWKILIALSLFIVVADQATKFLAVDRLTYAFENAGAESFGERVGAYFDVKDLERTRKPPVVVLDDYWQHRYVENPGAAWGSFRGIPDNLRVPFFYVVSIGAVVFIVFYFRRLEERQRVLQVALALVLGGAVGNFLDRLFHGFVIDFIDWHWRHDPNLHWPTFNVADVGISVGVTLMILDALFARKKAGEGDTVAQRSPVGNEH